MTTGPELWSEHDKKVKPYVYSHRAVGIARSVVGLMFLAVLVTGGRAHALETWVTERIGSPFLRWLVFLGILALAWEIISFPFSYGGYAIERKWELSKQSFGSWIWDKVKGLLLMAVLGSVAMGLVYISVTQFGAYWWLACATLFLCFSILLAQLAPVLLIPLFFKLEPMAPSPLKERLLKLCERFDVEVKDVYHLGLGEKTEKGNAAFVGLGRTKRILIGDTLYQKYPPEQVEAVFAHELGHQVHNDLWKGIGFSSGFLYLAFFVADLIGRRWAFGAAGTQLELSFGIFLFFMILSVVQWPIGVLQAMFSRARERAADAFASERIGAASPLADALEQLTLQNYSFFKPHAVLEFLTFSHPAPWRRITKLRS